MNFYQRVYELARRIPAGRCASYGQLALMLGNPRAARAVGYAMRACKDPAVPCHRVLRGDGSTAEAFGPGVQRTMLEAEGVALYRRRPGGAGAVPLGRNLTRTRSVPGGSPARIPPQAPAAAPTGGI